MRELHIIMKNGPGPDGDFVEVEDQDGKGMYAGRWEKMEDGLWHLIFTIQDFPEDLEEARQEARTVGIDEGREWGIRQERVRRGDKVDL